MVTTARQRRTARPRQRHPPHRRLGPRPLPVHLLSAGTTWSSSLLALPLLKSGLLPWKPEIAPRAAALADALDDTIFPDFARAVEAELVRRAAQLIDGIERYRDHPYRRDLVEPPAIWQEGTTRLIDYGPVGGAPVLVVPSLINRAHILDLTAELSLLRFLAGHGLRPLLVDWSAPGAEERHFDLTAYIAGRLEQALEAAIAVAGAPVAVLGYCMGGLLALALALRRRRDVSRLAVMATPWDFQTGNPGFAKFMGGLAEPIAAAFAPLGQVPTDILQTLFFLADPRLANRKFRRFAALEPASPEAENFVATEDWLNDGVPLALPVASECFSGWYGANTPLKGEWRVAGVKIEPAQLALPALVVVPAKDKLVPPVSALALAEALPDAVVLAPDLGHVGLVVGRHATPSVWTPLGEWLLRA
jgi:polyhydroxyalkanoate synthase subunit PhaC